jgi:hypothetical protein
MVSNMRGRIKFCKHVKKEKVLCCIKLQTCETRAQPKKEAGFHHNLRKMKSKYTFGVFKHANAWCGVRPPMSPVQATSTKALPAVLHSIQ